MTREEAIAYLNTLYMALAVFPNQQISLGNVDEMKESVSMAIQALSQEPCDKDCEHCTWTECPIEPCADTISREDARMMLTCEIKDGMTITEYIKMVDKRLRQLPSVTPKPDNKYRKEARRWKNKWLKSQKSKTGHWIEHPEIKTSTPEYLMFYECSECGDKQCFCKSDIHKKHFCNNCGARMFEPQESEG